MTKTVRKPDGSYETTKVTQDSSGHKTTTITRMKDGRKETIVTHDDGAPAVGMGGRQLQQKEEDVAVARGERNIFVTKEGYAMPRNLWWPVVNNYCPNQDKRSLLQQQKQQQQYEDRLKRFVGNIVPHPHNIQIRTYYILVYILLSVWCFRWNALETTDDDDDDYWPWFYWTAISDPLGIYIMWDWRTTRRRRTFSSQIQGTLQAKLELPTVGDGIGIGDGSCWAVWTYDSFRFCEQQEQATQEQEWWVDFRVVRSNSSRRALAGIQSKKQPTNNRLSGGSYCIIVLFFRGTICVSMLRSSASKVPVVI